MLFFNGDNIFLFKIFKRYSCRKKKHFHSPQSMSNKFYVIMSSELWTGVYEVPFTGKRTFENVFTAFIYLIHCKLKLSNTSDWISCMHTYIHTHMHSTYIHAYIQTYTHPCIINKYIHTYIYPKVKSVEISIYNSFF
jgi:hypothetical protein